MTHYCLDGFAEDRKFSPIAQSCRYDSIISIVMTQPKCVHAQSKALGLEGRFFTSG
jgi:hypothetical protein